MKIVLDTTILVRANEHSRGLARELSLRRSSEIVALNPLVMAPIRDVHDVMVIQTAIIGEADILCTKDEDFFETPAAEYLDKMGVAVVDDIALMRILRS